MQEKLQTITSMKDKLPAEAIGQLSESVDQLDAESIVALLFAAAFFAVSTLSL
jgi:hypothetical protein